MQNVKYGVIVAGLGLAVAIFMCNKGEEPIEIQKNDEIKTLWLCGACNHSFEMSTREEFEASQKVPSSTPPLFCPQCKARQCFRANLCEHHGTAFFGPEVPNSTGVCPTCNPDAKPIAPEVIEDDDATTDEQTGEEGPKKKKVRAI